MNPWDDEYIEINEYPERKPIRVRVAAIDCYEGNYTAFNDHASKITLKSGRVVKTQETVEELDVLLGRDTVSGLTSDEPRCCGCNNLMECRGE